MRRPAASFDDELNRYVIDHYRHLMTDDESEIVIALELNLKALQTQNPAASKKLAYARGLVDKPHVKVALDVGYHESRTQIRNRLLEDHADEIVLNRCPNCDALCRTPNARMCVICGHSWNHQQCGEQ